MTCCTYDFRNRDYIYATKYDVRIMYHIYAEKDKYCHDQVQDLFISMMNNPYIYLILSECHLPKVPQHKLAKMTIVQMKKKKKKLSKFFFHLKT